MPDQANDVTPVCEISVILLSDGNITSAMQGEANIARILQMCELAKYKLCQLLEEKTKKVVMPQHNIDLKRLRG